MMLLPIGIAVASVGFGALLGLGGRRGSVSAISTFAMVSALAVVVAHLLPDALSEIGLWALLVFAVSVVVPSLLEGYAERVGAKHSDRWGLELGYAALLIHKMADGVGLGTYATGAHRGHSHIDIYLAIAAHTVPVVALVAIAYQRRGGVRAVVLRCGGLALATVLGVYLPAAIPPSVYSASEPWITAVVAGLLLHVVAHDWSPELKSPKTARARALDVLAVAAGIAVVALGGQGAHSEAGSDTRARMGEALLELALSTAPALLIGLLIGAVLTALGPKLPSRWLRSGGAFSQALRGAIVGAPLPICACGVLPLAATLHKRGAGPALVVAFLIATPELGVETFALTASFMGWPFAIVRLLAAVALAMIAAVVVYRAAAPSESNDRSCELHDGERLRAGSAQASFLGRVVNAFDELLYHVAPWTLVGLIAAAYVQAVLSPDTIGEFGGYGVDIVIVSLVAVPSYVCAASATPLAAVLLAKGLSPGAVLVGLLLGPATNLATIGFLRKTFGGRATAIGVVCLVAASWAMAALINVVGVPLTLTTEPAYTHDHGAMVWVASAVLTLALVRSIWRAGLQAWLSSLGEGLGVGHSHHHHGHDHGHDHDHDHA